MRLASILLLVANSAFASPDPSGFYCTPWGATRACFGKVEGYPREVAFVFAPGVSPGEPAPLILYLHGNNPTGTSLVEYLTLHRIPDALERSGRKAIVVFPRSLADAQDPTADYRDFLAPGPKFEAFLDAAARAMGLAGGASAFPAIAMAGHSGAYRTLSAILGAQQAGGHFGERIGEVYLLDAAYGRYQPFVDFAAANPSHRFWSVFSTHGDLGKNNSCLMDLLAARGVHYLGCKPYVGACGASAPAVDPSCHPPEHVGSDDLRAHSVGFLQAEEQHNDVPGAYLLELLGSSK
jgi:hypothetical protein